MSGIHDALQSFNEAMIRRGDAILAEREAARNGNDREAPPTPKELAALEQRAYHRHCQELEQRFRAMIPAERWYSGSEGPNYDRRFYKGAVEILAEAKRACGSNELQAFALSANVCRLNGWITEEQRASLDLRPPTVPEAERYREQEREHHAAWQAEYDKIIAAVRDHATKSKGRRQMTTGEAFAQALGIWNTAGHRKYDDGSLSEFRTELQGKRLL